MMCLFFMCLTLFSFSPEVHAKSFTIDEVEIKGWIKPNGNVVMNEMFTYTLDGTFSQVTRSFPNRHIPQLENFEAYVVTNSKATMDALTWDDVELLQTSFSQATAEILYEMKNEQVTFFYRYVLADAVKTYETYSDLEVTYFENGKNHETDIENVSITYILPEAVNKKEMHGFIHSHNGQVQQLTSENITFFTPNSKARTITSTRLFFPSAVMTEQVQQQAPLSLKGAIQQENDKLLLAAELEKKRTNGLKIIQWVIILFVPLTIIALLLRFRFFGWIGSTDSIVHMDPLYSSFVDRNGQWHLKSFLSGLFSLVEKGTVQVRMDQPHPRFSKQENVPAKTLAYTYEPSTLKHPLFPIEQKLVAWVFQLGSEHHHFHLHDIAGKGSQQVKQKRAYERRQQKFEKEHVEWHEEVVDLLEEAGTISRSKALFLKIILVLIVGSLSTYGIWTMTDEENEWTVLLPSIVILFSLWKLKKNPTGKSKWIVFIVIAIIASQYEVSAMINALWLLSGIGFILMLTIPQAIPTSLNACYLQWSMAKFRRKMRQGIPAHYTKEEAEKWMVRAYLLHRPSKMPKIQGQLAQSSPIALLFALPEDPLTFVQNTWTGARITGEGSSWFSGGSGGDSGGYGGGGGDGGGGGAGAD